MPKYLVTIEAEGIAYPFFIEAPEQGRAIAAIKRSWERQGWGDYDAVRIETLKKDRDGIARPMRYTPKVYSGVQMQVHTCWLDMREGPLDPDHILRQLCSVLTAVLPASISGEVFEIVAAHERAEQGVSAFDHARLEQPASTRLLAQEALADAAASQREMTSDFS